MKYLTLRSKLDYSPTVMLSYLADNFWTFLCWAFGVYLLPVHSVIYIMLFMTIVDFITGIWKSIKLGQPISSKRIGSTIEKVILYMVGIVTSFVLQDHINIIGFQIMWIFATLIITREYISIIENIEAVTGTKLVRAIKEHLSKVLPVTNKETKNEDRPKEPGTE